MEGDCAKRGVRAEWMDRIGEWALRGILSALTSTWLSLRRGIHGSFRDSGLLLDCGLAGSRGDRRVDFYHIRPCMCGEARLRSRQSVARESCVQPGSMCCCEQCSFSRGKSTQSRICSTY